MVVPWWWSRGGGPVAVVRGGSVVVVRGGGPWWWSVMVVRPPATDVSFKLLYIYVIVDCFLHSGSWILSGLVFSPDLFSGFLFVSDFAFVCFLNICCSIVL